uniref:Uncharacterized protein n=1 Tax=Anguilla anguilla TaxID=7936 RepID=A0A0E9X171_ANGAN
MTVSHHSRGQIERLAFVSLPAPSLFSPLRHLPEALGWCLMLCASSQKHLNMVYALCYMLLAHAVPYDSKGTECFPGDMWCCKKFELMGHGGESA